MAGILEDDTRACPQTSGYHTLTSVPEHTRSRYTCMHTYAGVGEGRKTRFGSRIKILNKTVLFQEVRICENEKKKRKPTEIEGRMKHPRSETSESPVRVFLSSTSSVSLDTGEILWFSISFNDEKQKGRTSLMCRMITAYIKMGIIQFSGGKARGISL